MPKLGAKADERPYYYRCRTCGCRGLNRLVAAYAPNGTPARRIWACDRWPVDPHNCDDVHREGCDAERVYTDDPVHLHDDGNDGMAPCPGRAEDCTRPADRAGDILLDDASREGIEAYKDMTPQRWLELEREKNPTPIPTTGKACFLCISGAHDRSAHEVGVGEPPEAASSPLIPESPWKPAITSLDVWRVLEPYVQGNRDAAVEAVLELLHSKGIDCDPPF